MPKHIGLTDNKLSKAKPRGNPYKLYDSGGLFALVHPNGSNYWQLKYRYLGKEKVLSLGGYPLITLKEARNRRDEAKKLINQGLDPSALKKRAKQQKAISAANSFEAIAREWHENKKEKWTKPHAEKILRSLENDVFPSLGNYPITDIKANDALIVLKKIEKRNALDIARRVRQRMSGVFKYAIQTSRCENNPMPNLEGAIKTRRLEHRRRFSENELPGFLKALESYQEIITKSALKIVVLTFLRSSEVRFGRWEEINFKKSEWRIPAERMKKRQPHIVPLSKQALAVLQQLKPITGKHDLIFTCEPNGKKPISSSTMLVALTRLDYREKTTVHGFRGLASTILNENRFPRDVIERQLAHADADEVRAAYNYAEYLPERQKMMDWWGDYVEQAQKRKLTNKSNKNLILRNVA